MKKYKVGDVIDLDDVNISLAAHEAWQAIARVAALGGVLANIPPDQIPMEQGMWLPSGELETFVEIPGTARVSMKIPCAQWAWRK